MKRVKCSTDPEARNQIQNTDLDVHYHLAIENLSKEINTVSCVFVSFVDPASADPGEVPPACVPPNGNQFVHLLKLFC